MPTKYLKDSRYLKARISRSRVGQKDGLDHTTTFCSLEDLRGVLISYTSLKGHIGSGWPKDGLPDQAQTVLVAQYDCIQL